MGSPFPGVDPFLEGQHCWPDFHITFLPCWRKAISRALPSHYEARLDERVKIVEAGRADKAYLPDVAVVKPLGAKRSAKSSATATLEPVEVELPAIEEVREAHMEILHRPDRRLVAVLELLSPANKTSPGREAYWVKRMDLLQQPVHLVELDMLLGGDRLPMGAPMPPGDFYAIIARSEKRRKAQVFSWRLRDRLPTIPIPLLPSDGDVGVDLAEVFAAAYELGEYHRTLNYAGNLDLDLPPDTARWVKETVAASAT